MIPPILPGCLGSSSRKELGSHRVWSLELQVWRPHPMRWILPKRWCRAWRRLIRLRLWRRRSRLWRWKAAVQKPRLWSWEVAVQKRIRFWGWWTRRAGLITSHVDHAGNTIATGVWSVRGSFARRARLMARSSRNSSRSVAGAGSKRGSWQPENMSWRMPARMFWSSTQRSRRSGRIATREPRRRRPRARRVGGNRKSCWSSTARASSKRSLPPTCLVR